MKKNWEKYMPHLLAIILFLGLSFTYMAPIILENKDIIQGDVINSSTWGKDLKDYHQQTGEYAFWSNSMFSGMPANYTYMPPMVNLFDYISKAIFTVLPGNYTLILLYLLGFYIFLISIGCKPWLSIIGAFAYAFATYNIVIIEAGHVNKALVMATMAPMIGGIILTYRKEYLTGIIITLIATGMNVVWSHQQISYYQLIIIFTLVVVYFIYAIREKTLKDFLISSVILAVVALIAVAPSAGKLYATADYSKETMRGGAVLQSNAEGKKESSGLDIDYAFLWSYGKAETMTLLIPNFYGASSGYNIGESSEFYNFYLKAGATPGQAAQMVKQAPTYWGDETFTSGPIYMGAVICFLFLLGVIIVKKPEKWWMLIATIIAIVMAWGRHFPSINNFLFDHLPLYNKFRVPMTTLVIAELTMAALAILALKYIVDNKEKRGELIKPVLVAAGITGGLCLIFALFGGSLLSFSGRVDEQIQNSDLLAALFSDRQAMLVSDAWRSLALIALAAGTLWYYLKKPFNVSYVIAITGLLIFVDLWTVDKRFLNFESFVPSKKATEITITPVDELILRDKDPHYRVLNLTSNTFQESRTSNFHKSIGGYSPAKLRRYQDIIEYYFSGNLHQNILNMLNAKYIIVPSQQQGSQVHYNEEALGNVWFVNDIQWVNSPDEEIDALKDLDPSQTALIDIIWKEKIPNWERLQHTNPDSTAHIRLTDYVNPGNLIYESTSEQPHLAVFSEVFYKTWRVYIDGTEVPLLRVNYVLRGLEVPAGNHQIEFKCIDEIYLQGAKLSLIASILTGIILLSLFGYAIRSSMLKK